MPSLAIAASVTPAVSKAFGAGGSGQHGECCEDEQRGRRRVVRARS
jgi:hypothetical protein